MSEPQPLLPSALAYSELGVSVIPAVKMQKKGAVRWKRYQRVRPVPAQLRQWFADVDNYQLGVAAVLGEVSGGLLCRDFDKQAAYDAWKLLHPTLAKELPTSKTFRGCQVFARCEGYKRPDQRTFVQTYADGELRGDCHLAILPPSLHAKSGKPYQWIVEPRGEFPQVDLEDLGIPRAEADVTHVVCVSSPAAVHAPPPPPVCVTSAEEIILAIGAKGRGERNRLVFQLCRYLKGFPQLANLDADDLMPYVRQWFEASLPFIGTKEFAVTERDFRRGWKSVKYPAGPGAGSIRAALQRAITTPLPPEASRFKVPGVRLLVGLCRELQRQRGPLPFYLACRDAAEILGIEGKQPHVRAWRWLEMLCHKGVLQKMRIGSQVERKANEYRYLPSLDRGQIG